MAGICKKCGAELIDGAVFCSKCGERADGKTQCAFCGKLIPSDSVFCTYCGKRIDGKVICPDCGIEVDGSFCPKCGKKVASCGGDAEINYGANASEEISFGATDGDLFERSEVNIRSGGAGAPKNVGGAKKLKGMAIFKEIVKYLAPSLTLAAMVLLFIFSFFIDSKVVVDSNWGGYDLGDMVENLGGKGGIFYYFGNFYKDLKSSYGQLKPVILLPAIGLTASLGINLLASLTMLTIATVKFIKSVCAKKYANLFPLFAWSFATFIVAACAMKGFESMRIAVEYENVSAAIGVIMNACARTGIILAAVFATVAAVLTCVAKGKAFLKINSMGKAIAYSVSFILVTVQLALMIFCAVDASSNQEGLIMDVNFSFGALSFVAEECAINLLPKFNFAPYILGYISFYGLLIGTAVLIAGMISSFNDKKGSTLAFVGGIITVCFAIFYLVMAIVTAKDLFTVMDGEAAFGFAYAIATLVLALFAGAGGITGSVLGKKGKKPEMLN